MADKRITQLPASAGLIATDLVPVVDDPAGSPETQKATIQQVADAVQAIFDAANTYDAFGEALSAQTAAEAASINASVLPDLGDLVVGNGLGGINYDTLPAGANGTILMADSGALLGLRYATFADDQAVLSSQIFG
jgi:hypothetical protein